MDEHNYILQRTEEARLNQLYHSRCDEENRMDFTQFLLLSLDRGILSNSYSIEVFYTAFREAAQGEEFLDEAKFYFAITILAKTIFYDEDNPFETMFTTILMDKIITYQDSLVGGRIPKTDSDNLAVMSEDAVIFYIAHLEKLRSLYTTIYNKHQADGYNHKETTWGRLCETNEGILVSSFLRFCKEYSLVPHGLNIEALQEILLSIIPPLHKEEYEYFNEYKMILQYEKDILPSNKFSKPSNADLDEDAPVKGEPQLLFHEFVFTLGRIAKTSVKDVQTDEIRPKLEIFFTEKLNFPKVDDPDEYVERYLEGDLGSEHDLYSSDEDLDDYRMDADPAMRRQDNYQDDPQQMLHDFIERRAAKDENVVIDYEAILNDLNTNLPPIPPLPKVEPVNPPPYNLPREQFGKLLPKPEEDKKAKKKPPPKRKPPKPKKDEKPKKIYPYEEFPPRPPEPKNRDHLKDLKDEMAQNTFPKTFKSLECNPGVAPCVIKEVFIPPVAPQEFATLIESALVYQNTANYEMALATFEEVRDKWRKSKGVKTLRAELELFFELSLGSVYESSGRDELALKKYLSSKEIKLVYNHPDRAFPYCGIGSVLYHMEEPEWALRSYCKAREIREETIGGDTVDTATVYNNLGCCMMALERYEEANAYFELSAAIFEVELGSQHERTLTASRNILKCKRNVIYVPPEYKPLWTFAGKQPGPKMGKKKKKKKKGKKRK